MAPDEHRRNWLAFRGPRWRTAPSHGGACGPPQQHCCIRRHRPSRRLRRDDNLQGCLASWTARPGAGASTGFARRPLPWQAERRASAARRAFRAVAAAAVHRPAHRPAGLPGRGRADGRHRRLGRRACPRDPGRNARARALRLGAGHGVRHPAAHRRVRAADDRAGLGHRHAHLHLLGLVFRTSRGSAGSRRCCSPSPARCSAWCSPTTSSRCTSSGS
jgi:hypothetical protein